MKNLDRYIFTNTSSLNDTTNLSQFRYDLALRRNDKSNWEISSEHNTFHIYLIKSNTIPHFELLNNPAICCSTEGGIICDHDFERKHSDNITYITNMTNPQDNYKLLKTYAYYFRDIHFSEFVTNEIKLKDNQTINDEGIFHTILLLCSNNIPNKENNKFDLTSNDSVILNGVFSYSNPDGFLSADELFNVDIYLFFSLFYFILSIYWIYKIIMNYTNLKIFSKMLTLSLPIIILEKMMNLQIYSELNRFGEIDNAFEIILIACNLIKNVNIRLIFFGLSTGYSILYR